MEIFYLSGEMEIKVENVVADRCGCNQLNTLQTSPSAIFNNPHARQRAPWMPRGSL